LNNQSEQNQIAQSIETSSGNEISTAESTTGANTIPETPTNRHSSSTTSDALEAIEAENSSEADTSEPSGWDVAKAIIREVVETIVLALIMVFLIQLVIRNFRVDGHSMEPNLHHDQYLVVDKISYNLPFNIRPPRPGDVIVFEPPTQVDKDFVKRIIALPGDTVEIRQGQVYVNGELLPNVYEARLDKSNLSPLTVPEGRLFVLGDNRPNSNDSRNWGTLEIESVVGKTWLSYWPPESWGTISNNSPTYATTLKSLFEAEPASP